MRRVISILLAIVFGLGPITAALRATGDESLPQCCRRHGAHRCAMSEAALAKVAQFSAGTSELSAPTHCPIYPQRGIAAVAPVHALSPSSAALEIRVARALLTARFDPVPCAAQMRTRASRAPPSSLLS